MAFFVPAKSEGGLLSLELTEDEETLVSQVEACLENQAPAEAELLRRRFDNLRSLGEAISRFPSILESQELHGLTRNREALIRSLLDFSPTSNLLHIPTRIVAARSYLVAKCHSFSMLSILGGDGFYDRIRTVMFTIICTLVAEEVYFSCLADEGLAPRLKYQISDNLIALWESGTDPIQNRQLPFLEALWKARSEAPPVFGTMDGASELIRLSFDLSGDWEAFLMAQGNDQESRWALEEFIFGLSYEEIGEVRSRLQRFGINAVNRREVRSFLGSKGLYRVDDGADPRGVYDFYVDRRNRAQLRLQAGMKGPHKTLEELYLKYRILRT